MFKADGTFMVWSDHGGSSVSRSSPELDDAADGDRGRAGQDDRPQASRHDRGPRRDLDKRGPVGRHARDVRARGGPGPRQGRGRGAPAGAAGRAAGLVRRRVPAGPARVADRHRAGGPDVPRRRRRDGWRSRSSAWRGSRPSSSSRATWTGSGWIPAFASCRGVLAAQTIKRQARVLAQARGIECIEVDLDVLRGERQPDLRLFAA